MPREERLDKKTIPQLVKIYAGSPGGEDSTPPEFRRRGAPARDELIRMLDDIPDADLRADRVGTLVDILKYYFPSRETYDAVERLQARNPWPPGRGHEDNLALLRAKMRRRVHTTDPAKSPVEQSLEYIEFLLANCRPVDKVHFLAEAATESLGVFEAARELNDDKLQKANRAKAMVYAREILATRNLAAKNCGGEGV